MVHNPDNFPQYFKRIIDGETYEFFDSAQDGFVEHIRRHFNVPCEATEDFTAPEGQIQPVGLDYNHVLKNASDQEIKDIFKAKKNFLMEKGYRYTEDRPPCI
jgi:hypothetical protein